MSTFNAADDPRPQVFALPQAVVCQPPAPSSVPRPCWVGEILDRLDNNVKILARNQDLILETVRSNTASIKEIAGNIEGVEESLITKIEGVEASLETKIGGVEASLETKIGAVEDSLETKIGGEEVSLETKIEGVKDQVLSLETKMDASHTQLNNNIAASHFELGKKIDDFTANFFAPR